MQIHKTVESGSVAGSLDEQDLRRHVAEITAAYLASATVSVADVPGVIRQVAESLGAAGRGGGPASLAPVDAPRPTPAQIRASINSDWLVSFENGQRYKTLKRHLTERGMSPADYRLKWGLPVDYPMVAHSFHAKRSALSKALQLGQKGALSLARRRQNSRR